MTKPKQTKRENFDVSPEQQSEIEMLRELTGALTKKDAILVAVNIALHLVSQTRQGKQIFLGTKDDLTRFALPGIENLQIPLWTYLVECSHPWKKQLYVKGRNLPAAAVWTSMQVNGMTPDETAQNFELPIDAINEIILYCEANRELLEMEAAEDLLILERKGISVAQKKA